MPCSTPFVGLVSWTIEPLPCQVGLFMVELRGFDAMMLRCKAGYLTPNLASVALNAPHSRAHYSSSDSKSATGSVVSQKVPAGTVLIVALRFSPGNKTWPHLKKSCKDDPKKQSYEMYSGELVKSVVGNRWSVVCCR